MASEVTGRSGRKNLILHWYGLMNPGEAETPLPRRTSTKKHRNTHSPLRLCGGRVSMYLDAVYGRVFCRWDLCKQYSCTHQCLRSPSRIPWLLLRFTASVNAVRAELSNAPLMLSVCPGVHRAFQSTTALDVEVGALDVSGSFRMRNPSKW